MSLQVKVKKKELSSYFFAIVMYHIFFVRWYYFESYDLFKYILIFIAGILLLLNVRVINQKKNLTLNFFVFLFCCIALYSSYLNAGGVSGSTLRGIVFICTVVEIFAFIKVLAVKKQLSVLFKSFYVLSLFYCVITDLILLLIPNLYYANISNYFIGNKFTVSYLHIYLVIFYYFINKEKIERGFNSKRMILICYFLWAFIISFITECTTGIIGCLLVLIFFKIKSNLFTAKKWLLLLAVSDSILILFDNLILSIPVVQYFIINVLGESLDLHGRLQMYESVLPLIQEEFLFGYGANNYYNVLYSLVKAPNAQNGFLNSLVQYGIIGTVALVILLYFMLWLGQNSKRAKPFFILVFMLTILSSVEITINIYFVFFVALIFGIRLEDDVSVRKDLMVR
ncbi:O-antigen ligase [Bacillus sp. OK048]|uniref:O-antigen ligase family protein n=1 Tax=Bacillus sp. OK048 TaxID=1882761 RepID=UPI00088C65D6|nr:O-antigen ligase family protein [Bacillus sp. OK048]SDN05560.1 O-antigen ligase [Bacillus sp. OK048]